MTGGGGAAQNHFFYAHPPGPFGMHLAVDLDGRLGQGVDRLAVLLRTHHEITVTRPHDAAFIEATEVVVDPRRSHSRPERVLLAPDCGFATFADNPITAPRIAEDKLRVIAQAAAVLRRG